MAVLREAELEELIPTSDERPLLRGLIIGIAVGATIAGLIILAQTARKRQTRQEPPQGGADAEQPPHGDASPR
ncbi:hypothetical protein [Candidatus Viridilinea mediisalina]|uniref:Uncharacterized protein n=1 Tax=Candidatus Viridilinea mediisalina TaxID=2024553 RepID=A0A2A6RES7_9CHLR|nr:hypothetical protein [Candidatus Viridilinea mediisalina]PDW01189.1 hypothetical protein CJ255_19470 [Candidatus Viridilinea mediisalina]